MTHRIPAATAALLLGLGTLTACTGSDTPTTATTTPPTTSTAPSPSTSSTTTPATTTSSSTPDQVQQAEDAVVAFYKQMDQLGQGKLDINKVTTWDLIDQDYKDTRTKWSKLLGEQVYAKKVLQVGATALTDLSGKQVGKPKSNVKFDAAYSVVACVDRSGLTYEKNGKPIDYNAGVAVKTYVTHLVTENKGQFRVVRDAPGASC